MNVIDFADTLCRLNTAIAKYLDAKEALEQCKSSHIYSSDKVINTITDVLGEKIDQYEKQIIELATILAAQSEETPDKKKK